MKHILLVNQFSSVKYVAKRFSEYPDVFVTALYTVDLSKFDKYLLPTPDLFNRQIFLQTDDVNAIIAKLGNSKFDYVLNGFEASVKLSDALANHYTPQYANNPATYRLRSDKYAMHKILEQNSVSHINQFIYNAKDKTLPNLSDYKIDYPCFIKPLAGASSIGANAISNPKELEVYFANPGKYYNNYQNTSNQDLFLVAELIHGKELLVDTFSVAGNHYISTIQQYSKSCSSGKPIYESFEKVEDPNIIANISEYIKLVLDATELRNGFAHTELFLLPDNSLKLIEINPRVSGCSGFYGRICLLDTGYDQVSLLMKHIFKYQHSTGDGLTSRVLVLNNLSGKALPNLTEQLGKFSCVYEICQLAPEGHIAKAHKEINLSDAVAFVLIRSNSMEELNITTNEILKHDKFGW